MMTSSVTARCLQSPARTVCHMQAAVLCRHRRSIKPSTELLQIVPDLLEIFKETEPHKVHQRQRRQQPLHWTLLPAASQRLLNSSPQLCSWVQTAAGYSTSVKMLPYSAVQSGSTEFSRSEVATGPSCHQEAAHCEDSGGRNSLQTSSIGSQTHFSLSTVLADLQEKVNIGGMASVDQVQALVKDLDRRKRAGYPIPESVNALDLEHLLGLQSQSSRRKFLHFLLQKERIKAKRLVKKIAKCERLKAAVDQPELTIHNTIVRRGQSQAEDSLNNWTAARSMIFGMPIIFDLSFDQLMSRRELVNTVLQLGLSLKINKTLEDPFHIHFASIMPGGGTECELRRVHGWQYDQLKASVTHKPPQDIFPPERLVYLTADSPNVLAKFDPDKVYVIGGFVDRLVQGGVSLGRAESAGLNHARLPLDEHLRWCSGTKNLTLDQVLRILNEMKMSGDWAKALEHVPRRKHLGSRSSPLE